MKRMLRLFALLLAAGAFLCTAGCGYRSTFTDHFVRFSKQDEDKPAKLKQEWDRYKSIERTRLPRPKDPYLEE